MALVEVVKGPRSEASTIDAAVALAKRLGKTPVVVKDSPGFVVNRLLCPQARERRAVVGGIAGGVIGH